jgi:Fe-S-cluster containining protein
MLTWKEPSYETVFITDMLVPLTAYEAKVRWAELGYGDLTVLDLGKPLYTCRHWDTETRLCTVYDQRPWLCRDYPYTGACQHTGCTYRKGIDHYVDLARREWDRLDAYKDGS